MAIVYCVGGCGLLLEMRTGRVIIIPDTNTDVFT